ncbi:hypothetical protein BD311DRAFT_767145 [Dichomitus squalens]|uniref:Uncharacterized protein n=1 Tax=Dichomitus squalens TaxID=114155 RepID=A0A4Q9MC77_9APHY|nr:hypothetical protein BD311DRAFT_767145 [Dichomitus squalens]
MHTFREHKPVPTHNDLMPRAAAPADVFLDVLDTPIPCIRCRMQSPQRCPTRSFSPEYAYERHEVSRRAESTRTRRRQTVSQGTDDIRR